MAQEGRHTHQAQCNLEACLFASEGNAQEGRRTHQAQCNLLKLMCVLQEAWHRGRKAHTNLEDAPLAHLYPQLVICMQDLRATNGQAYKWSKLQKKCGIEYFITRSKQPLPDLASNTCMPCCTSKPGIHVTEQVKDCTMLTRSPIPFHLSKG
eukprot:1153540-Pelagomonas_calceolata.AAC.1